MYETNSIVIHFVFKPPKKIHNVTMNDKNEFVVKVEGPGVNIERKVPSGFAKKVILALLDENSSLLDSSPGDQETQKITPEAKQSTSAEENPELSIREFFDKHKPKRNVDKIATIALYLREHQEKDRFSKEDIPYWFEKAAEPVPKNIPRDIKWAVKNGWVSATNGDNELYYLTTTGAEAVQEKFPEEVVKNTSMNR